MEVEVTVMEALLLRAGTFASGNDDVKREAVKARKGINAALAPWTDAKRIEPMDFGGFRIPDGKAAEEIVTLSFDSADFTALYRGLKSFQWGQIGEAMEETIFDLTDRAKDWPTQAQALESFEKLPAERRKQVQEMMAKPPRKRGLPKTEEVNHDAN